MAAPKGSCGDRTVRPRDHLQGSQRRAFARCTHRWTARAADPPSLDRRVAERLGDADRGEPSVRGVRDRGERYLLTLPSLVTDCDLRMLPGLGLLSAGALLELPGIPEPVRGV